ncbi:hypothetical protein HJFPF1_13146 [Paramyrothecium foliicola]|nr:hypothetical protein HJFPF1_13146 [Paramyrothecium foliicola]
MAGYSRARSHVAEICKRTLLNRSNALTRSWGYHKATKRSLPFEMEFPVPLVNPAPTVIGAIWPMTTIATIFFALRIYCRIARRGQTWWDDYILGLGWLLLLAATSTLTQAMRFGHLTADQSHGLEVALLVRVTHTCHLLSMACTKTSFAVTLLRFSTKLQKYIIWFIIGTITFLFIFHVFAQWKGICGDTSPYKLPGACWEVKNPGYVNIVSSMYSALTDFVLAFLPWQVIWGLNMRKEERISVGIAMSFGIIAGITGIMKSVQSIMTLNPMTTDFLRNLELFWIFSLAEPSSTIIAASVPVLRVLIKDTARGTNYGSSLGPGGYIRSTKNDFHVNIQSNSQAVRTQATRTDHTNIDGDADSDRSILGHNGASNKGGIALTTEISVEYDRAVNGASNGNESYELPIRRISVSRGVEDQR